MRDAGWVYVRIYLVACMYSLLSIPAACFLSYLFVFLRECDHVASHGSRLGAILGGGNMTPAQGPDGLKGATGGDLQVEVLGLFIGLRIIK